MIKLGLEFKGITFKQPMHDMGNELDDAILEVKICDAGAGNYCVLNMKEISFETTEQLEELFGIIKDAFSKMKKEDETDTEHS